MLAVKMAAGRIKLDLPNKRVVLKNTSCGWGCQRRLCRGKLGHSLGALRHGVLGKLAGQDEAHGRLDLPGRHRGLFVHAGQVAGLLRDFLCQYTAAQLEFKHTEHRLSWQVLDFQGHTNNKNV